ncbi:hypothetical protein H8959_011823, partial [Pygathrix nigripes]
FPSFVLFFVLWFSQPGIPFLHLPESRPQYKSQSTGSPSSRKGFSQYVLHSSLTPGGHYLPVWMEDLTNPEDIRTNMKCDRQVSLYGYLRGAHLKSKNQIHMA